LIGEVADEARGVGSVPGVSQRVFNVIKDRDGEGEQFFAATDEAAFFVHVVIALPEDGFAGVGGGTEDDGLESFGGESAHGGEGCGPGKVEAGGKGAGGGAAEAGFDAEVTVGDFVKGGAEPEESGGGGEERE
jgi:hypothetical protein